VEGRGEGKEEVATGGEVVGGRAAGGGGGWGAGAGSRGVEIGLLELGSK